MIQVEHLRGHTWHGRKGAIKNAFRYSIDYALVNLSASVGGLFLRCARGRARTELGYEVGGRGVALCCMAYYGVGCMCRA